MTEHPSSDRLSDLQDGELPAAQAAELEAHLARCPECAALAAELRRVAERARSLGDRAPRTDLWPGVAAAIQPVRRRPRYAFSVPQLLAAGIALVTLTAGGVAVAHHLLGGDAGAERMAPMAPARVMAAGRPGGGGSYDAAVSALERELEAGRGVLAPATVRVVEDNLRRIDRAIADAERALAADSAAPYLHGHLMQIRMQKLALLRNAVRLTRPVS